MNNDHPRNPSKIHSWTNLKVCVYGNFLHRKCVSRLSVNGHVNGTIRAGIRKDIINKMLYALIIYQNFENLQRTLLPVSRRCRTLLPAVCWATRNRAWRGHCKEMFYSCHLVVIGLVIDEFLKQKMSNCANLSYLHASDARRFRSIATGGIGSEIIRLDG